MRSTMRWAEPPGTVAFPCANCTEAINRLRNPGSSFSTIRARVSSSRLWVTSATRARRSRNATTNPSAMRVPVRILRGSSTSQSTVGINARPRRAAINATARRRMNSTRTNFRRTLPSFFRSWLPGSLGAAFWDNAGESFIYFNSEILRTIHSAARIRIIKPKSRGEDQSSISLRLVNLALRSVIAAGSSLSRASGR